MNEGNIDDYDGDEEHGDGACSEKECGDSAIDNDNTATETVSPLTAESIVQTMTEIEYRPQSLSKWNKLTVKEQKEILDKKVRERAMSEARKTVGEFMQSAAFAKIDSEVQAAIKLACQSQSRGTSRKNVFIENVDKMFDGVGATIEELKVFLMTHWGREEFRKKIAVHLKSINPEERRWIKFNEESETWQLLAIGGDEPENFKE